jgi:hypothetical protein
MLLTVDSKHKYYEDLSRSDYDTRQIATACKFQALGSFCNRTFQNFLGESNVKAENGGIYLIFIIN